MANLNIKEIVEWMIEKAKDKASDSIAVIDEGEIVKEFGVEPGWLQSHGPEIYHECDRHSEVLDSLIYTGNDRDYWSIQITINKG